MPAVTTFQNPVHDLDAEVEFGETQEGSSKIFDADKEQSPTVLFNTDVSSGARADVARGARSFTHTDDEVDDLRFAFDSVRPAKTPWIEVATLLTVLRALGAKLELNELLEAAQTLRKGVGHLLEPRRHRRALAPLEGLGYLLGGGNFSEIVQKIF